MDHKTAVIGLGVMGQRMLGSMQRYAGFEAVVAYDPDAQVRRDTAAAYPSLELVDSPAQAIEAPGVTATYIACPPLHHAAHAVAGFEAGHAVWCEKPLGVDIPGSEQLVAAAQASGQVNIVNFSLASAVATAEIEALLGDGALGDIVGVDFRAHFARWPRQWQENAASWLALRFEGGFTREVVSHWIYLTERLFGSLALESADCRYPGGEACETHLLARLRAGDIPYSIACTTGGTGPDRVEYMVRGSKQSARILDWNRLYTTSGDTWDRRREDISEPRETGYERQLDNAARAVRGETHTMPDFAAALSVQKLIEQMLAQ